MQKDRAINEYQLLIKCLQNKLDKNRAEERKDAQENLNQQNKEREKVVTQLTNMLTSKSETEKTVKTSAELWSIEDELEAKEHKIFTLQRQLKAMEETNADLGERLNQTVDSLEKLKIANKSILKMQNTNVSLEK